MDIPSIPYPLYPSLCHRNFFCITQNLDNYWGMFHTCKQNIFVTVKKHGGITFWWEFLRLCSALLYRARSYQWRLKNNIWLEQWLWQSGHFENHRTQVWIQPSVILKNHLHTVKCRINKNKEKESSINCPFKKQHLIKNPCLPLMSFYVTCVMIRPNLNIILNIQLHVIKVVIVVWLDCNKSLGWSNDIHSTQFYKFQTNFHLFRNSLILEINQPLLKPAPGRIIPPQICRDRPTP